MLQVGCACGLRSDCTGIVRLISEESSFEKGQSEKGKKSLSLPVRTLTSREGSWNDSNCLFMQGVVVFRSDENGEKRKTNQSS